MCERHQQTGLKALQRLIVSSRSNLDMLIQLDPRTRKGEAMLYEAG